MKSLHVKPSLTSPEIDFNTVDCVFSISGQSVLTDVHSFYGPIVDWLEEFAGDPTDSLLFKFELDFYNLASAKRFMFIVYLCSKMRRQGCDVRIEWNFVKDDEFMMEFGQDLSELFDLRMTVKPSAYQGQRVRMAC